MGRRDYSFAQANRLYKVDSESTGNIAAAGNELIALLPTDGFFVRVHQFGFYVPAVPSATTGLHRITLYYTDLGFEQENQILQVRADYNKALIVTCNASVLADLGPTSGLMVPADLGAFTAQIQNIIFDYANGLTLKYENITDAIQTYPREYGVIGEMVHGG